jgi:hypothetical protein
MSEQKDVATNGDKGICGFPSVDDFTKVKTEFEISHALSHF